jgi:hypothetical protein
MPLARCSSALSSEAEGVAEYCDRVGFTVLAESLVDTDIGVLPLAPLS